MAEEKKGKKTTETKKEEKPKRKPPSRKIIRKAVRRKFDGYIYPYNPTLANTEGFEVILVDKNYKPIEK